MKRARFSSIAAFALAAACGSNDAHLPDAKPIDAHAIDAPESGSGSGSGSDLAAMEPSPHDHGLDVVVILASMVIVVGPVRSSRRRRENDAA